MVSKTERKKIDRENALKGTAKTRGKKRDKSKYGTRSWGFNKRGGKTTGRKYGSGKSLLAHIFRFRGKRYTAIVKKTRKGAGKQPFTATFLEDGKPQSSLDGTVKVEARSYSEAREKAVKEFKKH